MMIEKDYLAKHRFNVIVARPKKLFVKVFARISDKELNILNRKFSGTFRIVENSDNGNKIIEIGLDKLWYDHFVTKSFPILKREFYTGKLFKDYQIELIPQLKISFERLDSFKVIFSKLQNILNAVQGIFSNSSGFFNEDEFQLKLKNVLHDTMKAEKLSKFILSSYSGKLTRPGVIEGNAFCSSEKA